MLRYRAATVLGVLAVVLGPVAGPALADPLPLPLPVAPLFLFGDVPLGGNATEAVYVENATGAPLYSPSASVFAAAGPGSFDLTIAPATCPSPLPPGDFCRIDARFAPAGPGESAATLLVSFSGPGGGDPIAAGSTRLEGTGVAPAVSVAPLFVFGAVPLTGSETISVLVGNSSTVPLHAASAAVTATGGPGTFTAAIPPATCPDPLPPSGFCRIDARFDAAGLGLSTGTLSVEFHAAGGGPPIAIAATSLEATGIAPSLLLAPLVAFGDVPLTGSAVEPILLGNGSTVPLHHVTVVVALDGGPGAFSQSTLPATCPDPLPPGAFCRIDARFAAAGTGPSSATLTVAVYGPGGGPPIATASTILTGNGVTPAVSLAPLFVFAPVPLGLDATLAVEFGNASTVPLHHIAASVAAGSGPGSFGATVAATCPDPLPPGAFCRIDARFAPTDVDPSAATLTVTAQGPGGGPAIVTATTRLEGSGALPLAGSGAGSAGGGYVLVGPLNVEANRVRFEWAIRMWSTGISGKQFTLRFRSGGASYVLRTAAITAFFLWGPTGREHARLFGAASVASVDSGGVEHPLPGTYTVQVDAVDLASPGLRVDTFAAAVTAPDLSQFFHVGPLPIAGPTSEIGNRDR